MVPFRCYSRLPSKYNATDHHQARQEQQKATKISFRSFLSHHSHTNKRSAVAEATKIALNLHLNPSSPYTYTAATVLLLPSIYLPMYWKSLSSERLLAHGALYSLHSLTRPWLSN